MRELLLVSALGLTAGPSSVAAKSSREVGYSFQQAWPSAVRHLRVNEGFEISEKDEQVGYVVFRVTDDGRVFSGTLEVVALERAGRKKVRLVLHIEDRPSYMEDAVLERMLGKLREDHGEPAPAPPPPRKEKKPTGR